jgi:peptide-methionine (R)-S-oxide reductase
MIDLSEDEWKKKLSPEQYRVLREKGTEAPFTGELLENHETGEYTCAACGQVVFTSDKKFESGSGWPSFFDAASSSAIKLQDDDTHGMHRVEITCANCGGHLGHVFNDAPQTPTGQRFCINSAALEFQKEK